MTHVPRRQSPSPARSAFSLSPSRRYRSPDGVTLRHRAPPIDVFHAVWVSRTNAARITDFVAAAANSSVVSLWEVSGTPLECVRLTAVEASRARHRSLVTFLSAAPIGNTCDAIVVSGTAAGELAAWKCVTSSTHPKLTLLFFDPAMHRSRISAACLFLSELSSAEDATITIATTSDDGFVACNVLSMTASVDSPRRVFNDQCAVDGLPRSICSALQGRIVIFSTGRCVCAREVRERASTFTISTLSSDITVMKSALINDGGTDECFVFGTENGMVGCIRIDLTRDSAATVSFGRPLFAVSHHDSRVLSAAVARGTPSRPPLLATTSFDCSVQIHRLPSLEPVRTLTGHSDAVLSVALHPTAPRLVSADAQGVVRAWSLNGSLIAAWRPAKPSADGAQTQHHGRRQCLPSVRHHHLAGEGPAVLLLLSSDHVIGVCRGRETYLCGFDLSQCRSSPVQRASPMRRALTADGPPFQPPPTNVTEIRREGYTVRFLGETTPPCAPDNQCNQTAARDPPLANESHAPEAPFSCSALLAHLCESTALLQRAGLDLSSAPLQSWLPVAQVRVHNDDNQQPSPSLANLVTALAAVDAFVLDWVSQLHRAVAAAVPVLSQYGKSNRTAEEASVPPVLGPLPVVARLAHRFSESDLSNILSYVSDAERLPPAVVAALIPVLRPSFFLPRGLSVSQGSASTAADRLLQNAFSVGLRDVSRGAEGEARQIWFRVCRGPEPTIPIGSGGELVFVDPLRCPVPVWALTTASDAADQIDMALSGRDTVRVMCFIPAPRSVSSAATIDLSSRPVCRLCVGGALRSIGVFPPGSVFRAHESIRDCGTADDAVDWRWLTSRVSSAQVDVLSEVTGRHQ